MNNMKKTAALALALSGVLAVGGMTAYFTDRDSQQNKIEIGEVKIDLTEPKWDAEKDDDGDGIKDHAEKVVPTQSIVKDPMVTNKGKNDAYIFVTFSIPKKNIYTALTDGNKANNGNKAVTQLFDFLNSAGAANTPNAGWTQLAKVTTDANVNTYTYGYNKSVAPGASTNKLFDSVRFCNAIEGQDLENTVQNIDIKAYGIQSTNTGTMQEAYTKYLNQNK